MWKTLTTEFERVPLFIDCGAGLGVATRVIPDEDMEASSTKMSAPGDPSNTGPEEARLYSPNSAWAPQDKDPNPFLELDLGHVARITGVSTQGHPRKEQYVRAYLVMFSNDGEVWETVRESDGSAKVCHTSG